MMRRESEADLKMRGVRGNSDGRREREADLKMRGVRGNSDGKKRERDRSDDKRSERQL
jgi:hypothetical protein